MEIAVIVAFVILIVLCLLMRNGILCLVPQTAVPRLRARRALGDYSWIVVDDRARCKKTSLLRPS